MDGRHLIYFADPMCSWCWGFAPVIETVREAFGDALPIRLVLGGLRPGEATPMTDEARERLRGHWVEVTRASGQPFGEDALSWPGFVYDTDPAARAVVILRRRAPGRELEALHRLQEAFYLQGSDVTDLEVLASHAAAFGLAAEDFMAEMESERAVQETWRDYAIAQRAGVSGFPTLILGPSPDGSFVPITRGFQSADKVLPMIARYVQALEAAAMAAN